MNNTCKFWDGEKYLYGAAAQLAYIKSRGGWIQHHYNFALEAIAAKKVVEEMNINMRTPSLKRIK
jgi:hypothetical protein